MRSLLLALLISLLGACGEPPIDVAIRERVGDERVLDEAGILDAAALEQHLAGHGVDVVALAYETPQASCGEAFRAGAAFVRAWEADVAIVAVARPGDFTSDEETRVRCLGLTPLDDRAISADVRERIAEVIVPPITATNDWTRAFTAAADALAAP